MLKVNAYCSIGVELQNVKMKNTNSSTLVLPLFFSRVETLTGYLARNSWNSSVERLENVDGNEDIISLIQNIRIGSDDTQLPYSNTRATQEIEVNSPQAEILELIIHRIVKLNKNTRSNILTLGHRMVIFNCCILGSYMSYSTFTKFLLQ